MWVDFLLSIKGFNVKKLAVALLCLALSACGTQMKVVKKDAETGYFPTQSKTNVVTNKRVNLDAKKSLLVTGGKDSFLHKMVANVGYFDQIIDVEDLRAEIIKNNLTDQVPSIQDQIGLNKAAKAYKPFLLLKWDKREDDDDNDFAQLVLEDPLTTEKYFVAESKLDFQWDGVNDQKTWYPMMNALIDYIKANSDTYGK